MGTYGPFAEKKIWVEIHRVYMFYSKMKFPWKGGGHKIYNFLSPHPTNDC